MEPLIVHDPNVRSCFEQPRSAGLTDDVLVDVILRGEASRDSATLHDPPSRAGFDAYADAVRALRDRLVPEGWAADNTKNVCTVVAPDRTQAVAAMSGGRGVGQPDVTPQPKYPRGPAMTYAVVPNQLALFEDNVMPLIRGPRLWFLLVYREPGTDVVLAELSMPEAISEGGRVTSWLCRYLLPPIDVDPTPSRAGHDDEPDDSIDVPVSRK